MYIVFEGVVGVGKTTQSKLLVAYLKARYPDREILWTREPGGSEVADAIRKIVQGMTFTEDMDPTCEAYLYAASRAHTLRTVVGPALERGAIVIADRSVLTSLSWQGYGRGLGFEKVWAINKAAVEDYIPDVILHLDLEIGESLTRTSDAAGDKFESFPASFFETCRQGYFALASNKLFKDRWRTISAAGNIDAIFADILKTLAPQLTPEQHELWPAPSLFSTSASSLPTDAS